MPDHTYAISLQDFREFVNHIPKANTCPGFWNGKDRVGKYTGIEIFSPTGAAHLTGKETVWFVRNNFEMTHN